MKKHLSLILGILLFSLGCYAQTTAITATVVDLDSTTWANGTWKIAWTAGPNASNPSAYRVSGAALDNAVLYQNGSMNGSGVLTVTIYDTSLISPSGSAWDLTLCPNASAGCYVFHFASAGASENISSSITAVLPGPRFNTATYGAYGYNNTEAVGTVPGLQYYDTTLACPKVYSGSAWACTTGSGGPPTGAAGGNLGGTYPNPTVVSIPNTVKNSGSPLTVTAATGIFWNDTASAYSFNLPTPSSGLQLCFGNYKARSSAVSIIPPASVTIYYKGVAGTAGSGTGLVSSGAVGDNICVVATDSTTYMAIGAGYGTWTNN